MGILPATDSNSDKPSILKSTRISKGLTLEIVHEATKIPMDSLKAIEEGYSVRILSPFYYRGFIKIYAEFLGLDVAEMYRQYGLDKPAQPNAPVTQPPTKQSRKMAPQPNVIIEQLQEWISVVLKPKNLKLIGRVLGALLLVLLFFKMAGCIALHMGKKTPSPRKQTSYMEQERKIAAPQDEDEEKPVPAALPEVKHEALQVQSADQKVEVAVRAVKNTWLQVKADGKVVFQMTLNKGSMETWSADDRIELSGRNIEQLDMEVNEKHVGFLGGGERRIRRVLITKEGLTVKK